MNRIISGKIRLFIFPILLFLSVPGHVFAEIKTFAKGYAYRASEAYSKFLSRTIALREVKRLLLEELGTYLESITEVRGFRLTNEE